MLSLQHIFSNDINIKFNHDSIDFVFNSIVFGLLNARAYDTIDDKTLSIYLILDRDLAKVGLVTKNLASKSYSLGYEDFYNLERIERVGLIGLDTPFKGFISIKPKGINASDINFRIQLTLQLRKNELQRPFTIHGSILKVGSTLFHLNKKEFYAFKTYASYLGKASFSENDHYNLVAKFKDIQSDSVEVDESRYKNLILSQPDRVTLNLTKEENGDLTATPNLIGIQTKNQDALAREFNISTQNTDESATLHIDNELILLDGQKKDAIKEVLNKRTIPSKDVKDFFENPGSFFNADLIDLDTGFSYRVNGVVEYSRMSFSDLDGHDNDWFLKEHPPLIDNIESIIYDETDLYDFEVTAEKGYVENADSIIFKKAKVNLPEQKKELEIEIERIREKLQANLIAEKERDVLDTDISKRKVTFDINYFEQNKEVRSQLREYTVPDKIFDHLIYQPKSYQYEGINWIYSLYRSSLETNKGVQGGILADDMGLGKTYTSLISMKAIIEYGKSNVGTDKPLLVVAPLSLLLNWKGEVEKFFKDSPFHDVKILNGQEDLQEFRLLPGNERLQLKEGDEFNPESISYCLKIGKNFGNQRLDIPGRLVLTTYSALRNYQFSLARVDWSCVMFDEAQNIKNSDALQTRAAKALNADLKVMVTGTPVENNLEEYWCLMDTANPRLFGGRRYFIDNYITPIKEFDNSENKIQIGKKLYNDSGKFLLRRLKEDVLKELPLKHIYKGLTDESYIYLEDLDQPASDNQIVNIDKVRELFVVSKDENIALTCLSKIKNCYLHPKLTWDSSGGEMINLSKEEFWNDSARLRALNKIIMSIQAKEEKLIVFVISKTMQKKLRNRIIRDFDIEPDIISGDTKVKSLDYSETRLGIIDEFGRKEGFQIIILSPIAAGVGLNITAANHVFHLDRHWNPAKEDQANDRVYRIGQEKDVHIYYPISKLPKGESFDIKLDNMLSRKLFLKDTIMTLPKVSERELAISTMND